MVSCPDRCVTSWERACETSALQELAGFLAQRLSRFDWGSTAEDQRRARRDMSLCSFGYREISPSQRLNRASNIAACVGSREASLSPRLAGALKFNASGPQE
eukprot:406662-Pyramimonas_sp.AAC.1